MGLDGLREEESVFQVTKCGPSSFWAGNINSSTPAPTKWRVLAPGILTVGFLREMEGDTERMQIATESLGLTHPSQFIIFRMVPNQGTCFSWT